MIIAVFLLTMLLIFLGTSKVSAHSWYPYECCSDQDCAPATVEILSQHEIKLTNKFGSIIIDPTKTKARPSQDEHYHACLRSNGNGGLTLLCWFAPGGT